jgi:CrcB protein
VTVVLVAIAGAAGALSRWGIASWVGPRSLPWSTLAINISGSFLLGFVLRVADLRDWPTSTVLPIGVGFLGAFTTFSTFSVEVTQLLRDDRPAAALGYVSLSLAAGVAAAALGYVAAPR